MTISTLGAALTLVVPATVAVVGCIVPEKSTAVMGALFWPAEKPTYSVGPTPGRPAVGDLNRDGNLDIVVACGSLENPKIGRLIVLAGDGKGGFVRRENPIKIAPSARKVALGDMNGDGILDAIVAGHDTYTMTILLGDGKAGFRRMATSQFEMGAGPQPHCHAITVADINGDKKMDVLATLPNKGSVAVLLGDGKGGVRQAKGSPFLAGRHPYDAVEAVDVNQDGKLDIIIPDLMDNSVRILFGSGDGSFYRKRATVVKVGARPAYVATGDMNGDGLVDIFATHDDEAMVDLLIGDGKGGFKVATNSPFKSSGVGFFWGVVARDVDDDKKMDLVLGTSSSGVVAMLGDGKGGFTSAGGSPYGTGKSTHHLAMGDFNKDGHPDIVAANYESATLAILLHHGGD